MNEPISFTDEFDRSINPLGGEWRLDTQMPSNQSVPIGSSGPLSAYLNPSSDTQHTTISAIVDDIEYRTGEISIEAGDMVTVQRVQGGPPNVVVARGEDSEDERRYLMRRVEAAGNTPFDGGD